MSAPFASLNLRPQERRVLVIVMFLIFVVLNFWLVTPLIGQLAQAETQLGKSRDALRKYETEINRAPSFERTENRLREQGGQVLSEELQLQRLIADQATASGVMVSRYVPGVRTTLGRTNQFFEDQGLTVDFTTGGKEIVQFLVGLASGNSIIHVSDMNLRPDPSGTKLVGSALFVASYQKKNVPGTRVESGSQPRSGTTAAKPAAKTAATNSTAATSATNKITATNNVKTALTNSAKPPSKSKL